MRVELGRKNPTSTQWGGGSEGNHCDESNCDDGLHKIPEGHQLDVKIRGLPIQRSSYVGVSGSQSEHDQDGEGGLPPEFEGLV